MDTPTRESTQQATNTALAALAAAGDSFALGQLWEINRGFLRSLFWKWYAQHKDAADACGLTLEDFEQEGFFAVQYAAGSYDPEKGAFTTWLSRATQKRIQDVMRGGHARAVIALDGRKVMVSANPLNGCTSLDAPLDAEDAEGAALGDIQPDPAATAAFERAEEDIFTEELHAALEEALTKLSEREAEVIRSRYWTGLSLSEVGSACQVTPSRAQQLERNALRTLGRNPKIKRLHDEIIPSHAYHGTDWAAWNHGGSVEERTVELLERLGVYGRPAGCR
ncbi:MAG: sigma-70 family RNA polymerase sigma factor [Faecalibacterium sp.]